MLLRSTRCRNSLGGGGIQIEGDRTAAFGHRVPGANGLNEDGVWCDWHWDGRHLQIRSCRFGLYPLFVAQRAGEICVSNRLTAVLARCASWTRQDDEAVAVFLRLGFFLDDDTPFDTIKAFPPGCIAVWDGMSLSTESRARAVPASAATTSQAQAMAYADLFAQSMARRPAHQPVTLPLSGGRDSRHILFELCRSGQAPAGCITAELPPPRTNEDLVVARALCQRLGLAHETVKQSNAYLREATRKNELTSYCCDEHAWAMPLVDFLNRKPSTLYDGIGGDVLSAGLFSTDLRVRLARQGRAEELAADLMGDVENGWHVALTPQAQGRYAYDRALARVARAVQPHLDTPNPVASFFFWNRTRREIALYSYGMFRADSVIFAPYLDHALFDYLMGLPAELVLDKGLHTKTIEAAYPEWSGLRYTLPDSDHAATTWPNWRRRLFHTRLSLDFARILAKTGCSDLRVWPLIARLGNLAGRLDPDRYWFNIDRIQWLCEVQAVHEYADRPLQ